MDDEAMNMGGQRYRPHLAPTPARPLLGMTVLVVEDSRLASEAIRMLCLRSGARLRRADSLTAAHKHLSVYRPSVAIVDMGLPDGDGGQLIAELTHAEPRVEAVLGMSGEPDFERAALAAGADGFLAKPVESVALFQQTVLAALPAENRRGGPRALSREVVTPDPLALEDDLRHAVEILRGGKGAPAYVAQFLAAVAHSARDAKLAAVASGLRRAKAGDGEINQAARLVEQRIASLQPG